MKYLAAMFAALLILPWPVLAETIHEEKPAAIIISEVGLWPAEEDLAWVELHNTTEEIISLEGGVLEFFEERTLELFGFLYPGQYGVFVIEEPLGAPIEDIILLDNELEILDMRQIPPSEEAIPSLALIEGELKPTWLPTPGRPNLIVEKELPVCEEHGTDTETDDENSAQTDSTEDDEPTYLLESGDIILSEIYANPLGSETEEEFIELYNTESRTVNLEGWILADATKSYTFKEPVLIGPHMYKAFYRPATGIALNNGAETVTLTDPFKHQKDTFAYQAAAEGVSWNTPGADQEWYEALPSPNKANTAFVPSATETEEEDTDDSEETVNDPVEEITDQQPDPGLAFIRLNELMPNPVGSDDAEWIELYNDGNVSVELAGLLIADASKSFELVGGTLDAGEYLLLERSVTGIALNNSDETLELRLGDQVLDRFHYDISREGASWSLIGTEWVLTDEATPGEENIFVAAASSEEVEEKKDTVSETPKQKTTSTASSKSSAKQEILTVTSWAKLEDGQQVRVNGVISIPPGILQKRIALMHNIEDETEILELYFHQADWPRLEIGQELAVAGEVSITSKGTRILIRSGDDITIGEIQSVAPLPYSEAPELGFSMLEGAVLKRLTSSITVDANGEQVIIDYKATREHAAEAEEDDLISAIGFKTVIGGKPTLLLAAAGDVIITKPEPEPVIAAEAHIHDLRVEEEKQELPLLWTALGGSITAAGFTGARYLPLLQSLGKKTLESIRDRFNV